MLDVINISKSFGGLRALNNVNLNVAKREILGVIGPNGAGKTTLFNVISGSLKPTEGHVIFEGENITGLKMSQVAKKGIVRTFQATSVWKEETVLDNVLLSFYTRRRAGWWDWLANNGYAQKEDADILDRAGTILEYMGLADLKEDLAKNLPHGNLRALGIAIALALDPRILLLDEPVTGMNPVEKAQIVELIRGLRTQGLTIIVIEHDMATVMKLVDRIVVLDYGEKIAEGPPEEVKNNKAVIEAYLGAEDKNGGSA